MGWLNWLNKKSKIDEMIEKRDVEGILKLLRNINLEEQAKITMHLQTLKFEGKGRENGHKCRHCGGIMINAYYKGVFLMECNTCGKRRLTPGAMYNMKVLSDLGIGPWDM